LKVREGWTSMTLVKKGYETGRRNGFNGMNMPNTEEQFAKARLANAHEQAKLTA